MKWIKTKDRLPTVDTFKVTTPDGPTWNQTSGIFNDVLVFNIGTDGKPKIRLIPHNLVNAELDSHWAAIDPPA